MASSILLIEDDLEMRELLADALEDSGYFCQGASSADEALRLAGKFQFDLVISDVRMAGSMDGLGAVSALKARRPEMRCIIITGFANEDAPRQAVKLLVDDYVYKPFRLPEFLLTVKRTLNPRQDIYRTWAAAVFSGPRKLLEKVEAARREAAMKALTAARDRCVQGYYVAIRSKLLVRSAALELWDRLEVLDARQDRPDCNGAELVEEYRKLHEWMTALATNKIVRPTAARAAGQVSLASFGRFYDRILAGELQPEHVTIAGMLRNSSTRPGAERQTQMAEFIWK